MIPSRRQLILGGLAGGVLGPSLAACSSRTDEQQAALSLRRPIIVQPGTHADLMRELVRYATLAPSSHNTQCWTFKLQPGSIEIAPDPSRRCPIVDPDDHHLYVSLGCATENLAQAALAYGLNADARFNDEGAGTIIVGLEPTQASSSTLFRAIPERQCTRGDYDGKPIASDELRLLEAAGTGARVHVILMTEAASIENVLEYVVSANTAQMNDAAFMAELKTWVRFDSDEALRRGDGLFAGTTGTPAMPRWLGTRMMDLFLKPKSENDRYARQIRNSAGIAVFHSEANDKTHWVEAGRCYERFALQATALGIHTAFLNQPVEVRSIRPQFAAAIGLKNQRPDLVVRFGRGLAMPWSMRRPVQEVLG